MLQEHQTQAAHENGALPPKAGRTASLKFSEIRAKFDAAAAETSPPRPLVTSPTGRLRQLSKSGSLQPLDSGADGSVFSVIANSMEHTGESLDRDPSASGQSTPEISVRPAPNFRANLSAWRTATLAEQQAAAAKQAAMAQRAQSAARSPSFVRRRSTDAASPPPWDQQQVRPALYPAWSIVQRQSCLCVPIPDLSAVRVSVQGFGACCLAYRTRCPRNSEA